MTPLRLFLAIQVPEKMKNGFLRFQMANPHLSDINTRWTRHDNLHVTLFFLGNVSPHNIPPLTQTLRNTFEQLRPFVIEFDQYMLQSPADPRMIWARFHDNKDFSHLSQKSAHACRKFMEDKFSFQKKQIPHVTLARLKNIDRKIELNQTSLSQKIISIDHAELWQSERSSRGAVYKPLARFSLKSYSSSYRI